MQLFKLAANSEFRDSAKKVVEELRKAGVDITSEVSSFVDHLPLIFY
jgi:biotin operon repressor